MGMSASGSGSGNSSTNLIPSYAQEDVKYYVLEMKKLSEDDLMFSYTNETYATQAFNETDGIDRLATRAVNGSSIITKGETLQRDTLDGAKLNSNPKLDDLFSKRKEVIIQEFDEDTLPKINAAFNAIGRFGGGSHHVAQAKAADAVMKRIADIAVEVYGAGYWAERAIQIASLDFAIAYGTQEVKDIELQRKVGLFKREYAQGASEDTFRRDRAAVDARIKRIEILGNAIRTVLGSHVTRVEPMHIPGPFAQMAGFALAGMGLYGMTGGSFNSAKKPGPTDAPEGVSGSNPFINTPY